MHTNIAAKSPLQAVQGSPVPRLPRLGDQRTEFRSPAHPKGLRLGDQHYYLRGRQWTVTPDGLVIDGRTDWATMRHEEETLLQTIDRFLASLYDIAEGIAA